MANKVGNTVPRDRSIEMPTRERLLSLIQILQDYDRDHPIRQTDLYILLYYEYRNYILSQLSRELSAADCGRLAEADDLIKWLKAANRAEIRNTQLRIDTSGAKSVNTDNDHREKYNRLIEIAEGASFSKARRASAEKLIGALYDIESGEVISCASSATLAADMRALTDEDYEFAASTGRRGVPPAARGVYGRLAHNNLEIWQLKILYETMHSIRFLQHEDVADLIDILFHVTSASKHDAAESICHKLDLEYYSRTDVFRNNLKLLIDAQITEHNVTFNYRHSTVDPETKMLDAHSPYTVFPVDIVFKDNYFYLLGASESGVRPYRIDRMIDVRSGHYNPSFLLKHPEYRKEKELFAKNNTNNFGGGEEVEVMVRWDFDSLYYYTPLFDVFNYENISQGPEEDLFIIKTRDNYGLYLNLLRLGPVIEVVGPPHVRTEYARRVRQMYEKHQTGIE